MLIPMNVPFFKQENDWFCGPAVVQSVLGAFGVKLTQKQIATELGTSPWGGTDRADMGRPLRRHGLKAKSYTLGKLSEVRRFLNQGFAVVVNYIEPDEDICHFAVITRVTDKDVYLVDPWNGPNFRLAADEFVKRWYGCAPKARERWFLVAKPKRA
jgi:ABC-type bacteriocin/lantibiotic exporter with double-glycine peptidase domain